MRSMIIVKATKDTEAGKIPEERLFAAMAAYHEELVKAGVLLDASGLQPTSKGWRIKYSGRMRIVVDGPFVDRPFDGPFGGRWAVLRRRISSPATPSSR